MREGTRSKSTRQAAIERVKAMERPESIGKHQWRGVKGMLLVIASYYPRPYPSQQTMADEMGVCLRSIQGYVRAARDAGLLQVTPDAGKKATRNTFTKTNLYAIPNPQNCPHAVPQVSRTKPLRGTTYPYGEPSVQETSSLDPKVDSASGRIDPLPPTKTPSEMNPHPDPTERERDISPRPVSPRPMKQAPRRGWVTPKKAIGDVDSGEHKPKRKPAKPLPHQVLAEYFLTRWDEMTAEFRPEFRKIRPLESLAHVKSYHALHWSKADPEWVKSEMDRFINAVARGREQVKPGQSAWMCFTGQWGRQAQAVDDPSVDRYARYRKPKP